MALSLPRGGAATVSAVVAEGTSSVFQTMAATPTNLFHTALVALGVATALLKVLPRVVGSGSSVEGGSSVEASSKTPKSAAVKSLQRRFLAVFWLLRCADWLQGPYFYEVYASKLFGGKPASMGVISKLFLTGFASTAVFGPFVGRAADARGRKLGTLAFTALYAVGACSTKSPVLWALLLGRVASGIGTSLLFSAPESWLVGEAQTTEGAMDYLGDTFGMAYAGDSLVAIAAGQLAALAASKRGPTGPFELSVGFLGMGALLTSLLWKENVADTSSSSSKQPSIKEAVDVIRADPKIIMVGATQSLFEAAMYIFVLQWPPAISKAVSSAFAGASTSTATPYGTVFSCFMASCLLGSTMFGFLGNVMGCATETSASFMLALATVAMGGAAFFTSPFNTMVTGMPLLGALVASLFAFEACVGMYFPSIGTLRSKYVPDSHRSVIMNLWGIPLNVLVVSVFLGIHKLGISGALSISTASLGLASLCMFRLRSIISKENDTEPKILSIKE
eukprot:scaffold138951_cov55-Attheya_sp.AAC.4